MAQQVAQKVVQQVAQQPGWRAWRALLGLAAMGAALPALAQLVVYEHENFRGRSATVTQTVGDFRQIGFNDQTSSVEVRSGRWRLCSDVGQGGQCVELGPGRYPSLQPYGLNDSVSSARDLADASTGGPVSGGGAAIELFEHANFGGHRFGADADNADLQREGFNDQASSVIVRSGRWELCTDVGFRGRCTVLGPGRYAALTQQGLNDQVSSFRQVGAAGGGGGGGHGGGWQRDEPEITFGAGWRSRVSFANGCVVHYEANGQRQQQQGACDAGQLRQADDYQNRFRREFGRR